MPRPQFEPQRHTDAKPRNSQRPRPPRHEDTKGKKKQPLTNRGRGRSDFREQETTTARTTGAPPVLRSSQSEGGRHQGEAAAIKTIGVPVARISMSTVHTRSLLFFLLVPSCLVQWPAHVHRVIWSMNVVVGGASPTHHKSVAEGPRLCACCIDSLTKIAASDAILRG